MLPSNIVVVAIALLDMLLLWAAVSGFMREDSPLFQAFPGKAFSKVIKTVIAVPLILALASALLSLVQFGYQDATAHASHAVFLLGWWLSVSLFAFSMVVVMRSPASMSLSAPLGFLLTLAPAAYFTPLGRFAATFQEIGGYERAIIVGVSLLAMCYTIIRRMYRWA